jgi:hypothetical protein
MYSLLKLSQLYPYPYKTFSVLVSALIVVIVGLPIYGISTLLQGK